MHIFVCLTLDIHITFTYTHMETILQPIISIYITILTPYTFPNKLLILYTTHANQTYPYTSPNQYHIITHTPYQLPYIIISTSSCHTHTPMQSHRHTPYIIHTIPIMK
ncbi:hypothetical protein EON63_15125 [archaeon]|nr:MAG: hypothetical protein EON63_15125 [archaeon]